MSLIFFIAGLITGFICFAAICFIFLAVHIHKIAADIDPDLGDDIPAAPNPQPPPPIPNLQ